MLQKVNPKAEGFILGCSHLIYGNPSYIQCYFFPCFIPSSSSQVTCYVVEQALLINKFIVLQPLFIILNLIVV